MSFEEAPTGITSIAAPSAPGVPRRPTVLGIGRGDILALGASAALALVALGVSAGVTFRVFQIGWEAERLDVAVRRAGDVEGSLARVEAEISACRAGLDLVLARTPADLRPGALDDRIEYRAKEHGLAFGAGAPWYSEPAVVPLPSGGRFELRRHDRALEFAGSFRQVLAMLADMEAWDELIAVRRILVRRGTKPGETIARLEVSAFQAAGETKP